MRACDTRWLSKLNLIQSIQRNLDDLVQLRRNGNYAKFFDTDVRASINLLSDAGVEIESIIKIYKLFEDPIICFQNSTTPQIHAVWPLILKTRVII